MFPLIDNDSIDYSTECIITYYFLFLFSCLLIFMLFTSTNKPRRTIHFFFICLLSLFLVGVFLSCPKQKYYHYYYVLLNAKLPPSRIPSPVINSSIALSPWHFENSNESDYNFLTGEINRVVC
jgi:hypothetical protein